MYCRFVFVYLAIMPLVKAWILTFKSLKAIKFIHANMKMMLKMIFGLNKDASFINFTDYF